MYYYIYDDFVSEKKYERELIAIENRLADLGLSGRVARLALFRNARELISDELRKGNVSTVVVVGNDSTVHKVVDVVSAHDVVLGILPIGEGNHLALALGVGAGLEAVDCLSARNIESIDTGDVNGKRFLSEVRFPREACQIVADEGKYRITPVGEGEVAIQNLVADTDGAPTNPTDGKLSAKILVDVPSGMLGRKKPTQSVVDARIFEIEYPEPVVVHADGCEIKGQQFSVSAQPKALRVIIGKARAF